MTAELVIIVVIGLLSATAIATTARELFRDGYRRRPTDPARLTSLAARADEKTRR